VLQEASANLTGTLAALWPRRREDIGASSFPLAVVRLPFPRKPADKGLRFL